MHFLAGFISTSGLTTDTSEFLIPFFRSTTSNMHFTQELLKEKLIERFLRCEPSRYLIFDYLGPPLAKKIGDMGLSAYRQFDGNIVINDIDLLAKYLADDGALLVNDPLTTIELAYLTRDFTHVNTAIEAAVCNFCATDKFKHWGVLEKIAANNYSSHVSWTDHYQSNNIFELFLNLDADEWPKLWVNLWDQNISLLDLAKLAVIKLPSFPFHNKDVKRITDRIIAKKNLTLRDSALLSKFDDFMKIWIFHISKDATSEGIFQTSWLTYAHHIVDKDQDVKKIGLDYLTNTYYEARIFTTKWIKIWVRLWQSNFERDELVAIARHLLFSDFHRASFKSKFAEKLLRIDSSAIESILHDWVLKSDMRGPSWIKAYQRLLKEQPTAHLLEIGKVWLEEDAGNYRIWPEVYATIAVNFEEREMLDIAKSWILRSNYEMTTWPDFTIETLSKIGFDEMLVNRAYEWLDEHQGTTTAFRMATFLEELQPKSMRNLTEGVVPVGF